MSLPSEFSGAAKGTDAAAASAAKKEPPLALVVGLAAVIVALLAGATVGLVRPSGPSPKGHPAPQVLDTSPTAAQLLVKSLTAARKAGAAHVSETHSGGDSTDQTSFEASLNGGTWTETIKGGTARIIVVGGQVYIEADASFLTSQFNESQSVAQKLGGRWVIMPPDNDDAKQIAGELNIATIVDQLLALSGTISKGPVPAAGQIALTGNVPLNDFTMESGAGDPATLVISSQPPFLPVSISYSDSVNGTETLTFTSWGEPVPLSPPASALALPGGAP